MPEPAEFEPSQRLTLERYLAIYDSRLRQLSTYFVIDDRIDTKLSPERQVHLHGDIECRGDLVLHVDERLHLASDRSVRGTDYSYDAEWLGPQRRKIFRYDNAHIFEQYNHPDEFHKHVWNPKTGRELTPQWIGRHAWPDLCDVLDELYEWWREYKDELGLSD